MKNFLTKLSDCPYTNTPSHLSDFVEVYDEYGRPFLLTLHGEAKKKQLIRRSVIVFLKNNDGQVFITKHVQRSSRQKKIPLWNVSAKGDIFAGESASDAVLRLLKENFLITRINLQEISSLPFLSEEGKLSASFFLAGPSPLQLTLNPQFISDGMFVDTSELAGLITHQPDMFHPMISWALRAGWL